LPFGQGKQEKKNPGQRKTAWGKMMKMGEEGSENSPDSQGKSRDSEKVVPFVVPFQGNSEPSIADIQLSQLLSIWPKLSPESRTEIVDLASRMTGS
jgi:hypothetical protein